MTTPRFGTIPSVSQLTLERLDSLINGYLSTLLEHTDDVKLSDFTRLVDLRRRIKSTDAPSTEAQDLADAAREETIPRDGPIESQGEEPSA